MATRYKYNFSYIVFSILLQLLLVERVWSDARAHTVKVICSNVKEDNTTIFVPNFIAVMENVSQQIRNDGLGVAIKGSGPNANFGLGQCYGDLTRFDCSLCYAEARTILPQCYPYKGGRIFLDGCFMRSDNYSFFEEYKGAEDTFVCGNSTKKSSGFVEAAKQAVSDVVASAASNRGFARSKVAVSGSTNESVYVLSDCWRTISTNSCRSCLENASAIIQTCLPLSEGRVLNTGCFMRYSDTDFFNKQSGARRIRGSVVVIIVSVISSVIVLVVGIVIGLYIWKNRIIQKKRRGSNDAKKLAKTLNENCLNFKYSSLEKATGSFDDANKLGQGGFGTVYKGVLQDGREIAVKRLFFNNRHRAADFYNEVNIISSAEHRNLVRLLGCSNSGPESLLVYEFVPNRSLDRFIFDANRGKVLTWEKRYEIIIGTAEGLVYLHETCEIRIIHRDIKASNILLDSRLRAKIADFGLARSFQEDKSHISTAIAGTLGYMAPEYLAHGQLSEKADVYSYGVLVLEIITGKQNNTSKTSDYSDSLVTTVWKYFQSERIEELYDPNLMLKNCNLSKNNIKRVIQIGLLCAQESPLLRPSMSKALLMLTNKDEHLPSPTNPAFMDETKMELGDDYPAFRKNNSSDSVATISKSSFSAR